MKTTHIIILLLFSSLSTLVEGKVLWEIGVSDNSSQEFALSPGKYAQFLTFDFGWEDTYFLIGSSVVKDNWPYVLPGPSDKWGGTWSTSGWRSHTLNILFGLDTKPKKGPWKLVVDILDSHVSEPPLFKVTVNGKMWTYRLPKGSGQPTIEGKSKEGQETIFAIPLEKGLVQAGGNQISLTILEGSCCFSTR